MEIIGNRRNFFFFQFFFQNCFSIFFFFCLFIWSMNIWNQSCVQGPYLMRINNLYLVHKMFKNLSPNSVRSGRTCPANLGVRSCPVRKLICPVRSSPNGCLVMGLLDTYSKNFGCQMPKSSNSWVPCTYGTHANEFIVQPICFYSHSYFTL